MTEESILRAKWCMDGAATLSQAAAKLRAFADEVEELEREGWQLTQPICDDYAFIEKAPMSRTRLAEAWAQGEDQKGSLD